MEPATVSWGTKRVHQIHIKSPRPLGHALCLAVLWALTSTTDGLATQGDDAPPSVQLVVRRALSTALRPDSVLFPPGGPRVIRLSTHSSELTTLRLSIPVQEGPAEAGAAQILMLLGLERARAAAAAIGARVEGIRTPWGIAYTVTGPTADFDHLAYVLREAVAEPRFDRIEFERARSRVRGEAQRERETASGRLAAELRAAAAPEALPSVGTPASLDMISMVTLRYLWGRTHRREEMSLVLVGPEPVELVLASLRDIGAGEETPIAVSTARPPAEPDEGAEVLRNWYGTAWVAGDARDPHGEVVASLIARRLREEEPAFETSVQLWYVGSVRVLAVTGAAYGEAAPVMRRRVDRVLDEAAESVGRDEVAPTLAALRFDFLSGASTPWGLAGLVGRYHDATRDPYAAYQHVAALDEITPETIGRYIQELARSGPVRAEVAP